ncbi:hypothetical protein WL44_22630 [Burkholderia ubonensis]|nr:hypothetical protein WL44_22630 [Burkholderia ubonensis]
MLARLSFTFAVDLHARAVDHQMDRFAVANARQLDLERLRTAEQRCAVRRGQGGEPGRRLCAKPCRARSGRWNTLLRPSNAWISASL